jgi:glycosyltransferase involved in cell wall biosynthesis
VKINIITGFFLPVPPIRGGATEKIWDRLSRLMASRGHEVTLISRDWRGFPTDEICENVRHIRLPGREHTRSLVKNLWLDLHWGRRVARRLPAADVTVCNTVFLPIWLRRSRPDAGKVVAVMARMPKGQARFYRQVDLVLALSDAVAAALLRENPRLAGRIAAFPFPIDWTAHATAAEARSPSPNIQIGYIGRIHPEKGIELLLDAAASIARSGDCPQWHISLTGPVDVPSGGGGTGYWQQLVERYRELLGERLTFHGPEFDADRLASTYASTDIFCYPSLAESGETFGVAVAEAMAARCAVVVSSLECFRDLVSPHVTGLTFDHRSERRVDELARQILRLLRDRQLRERLGTAGQAHVRRFDYDTVCTSVLRDFEQTLAR